MKAKKKFPANPNALPGPNVPPKMSPMRLPMATPHAAAGPNMMPKTTGMTFAGRISVMPGIIVSALNGMRTAANSAATTAVNMIIRVLRHIVKISRMLSATLRCVI
jgi:hypothetical protein